MKCYVIRHAHKEVGGFYNHRLRHQDEPLSPRGRDEARKLAAYFSDKPIAAIYVSAYQRTGQTIEHVARQHNLVPMIDERLNEIDNGLLEGLSDDEIQRTFPDVWRAFMDRTADFRFPEGETGQEVGARVTAFLEEKRRVHAEDEIIAVGHDGLIRALMCVVMDVPEYRRWRFRVDFCGITEIVPDRPGAWKLIRFNQSCL